jgi:short-subunit dehydrogenase
VTGAAGGIGAELARQLHARGMRIALLDVDASALDGVASELPRATTHVCDLSDEVVVARTCREVLDAHGGASLLINNAGISVAGPVDEVPLELFRRAMDVNFWGMVLMCRELLPALRESARRGRRAAIGNVLSDFALFSLPTKAPYAASKHAARAFSESLGAELHGTGISVSSIYPGATATGIVGRSFMVDESKRQIEADFLAKGLPPAAVARAMLHGIDRGRSRVLIGRDTRAIDLTTRLAPTLVQAAIRRSWRRVPFL